MKNLYNNLKKYLGVGIVGLGLALGADAYAGKTPAKSLEAKAASADSNNSNPDNIKHYKISTNGLALLKEFEGYSAKKYWDVDGYSIGYGHKILPGENYSNLSQKEAENILIKDTKIADEIIDEYVKVPLNQNQYDALVSFTHNFRYKLCKSTLLKKLNKGDYQGAANEFEKWNKADGKVNAGLIKRRIREKELFLKK